MRAMIAGVMVACVFGQVAAGQPLTGVREQLSQRTDHKWQSVNTRGMGFVTGGVAHPLPPHNLYIRTDVGGAYRLDRARERWVPLMDTVPQGRSVSHGVEAIAIDPSNPARVALFVPWGKDIEFSPADGYEIARYRGEVLVSSDAGATWQNTGLHEVGERIDVGPNELFRGESGERLAIDPYRSDVMFVSTRSDGLWRKAGAAAWQRVMGGLPDPATLPGIGGSGDTFLSRRPGYTFVMFDPRGVAGQLTRTIFVGVWGSGVWRSTDAGVTWSRVSARPWPSRAAITPSGTLLVAEHEDYDRGGISRIVQEAGGTVTVTNVTPTHANGQPANRGYGGIAIDPRNPNVAIACYMYGYAQETWGLFRTVNGGATWTELQQGPAQHSIDRPGYMASWAGDWGRGMLFFDTAGGPAPFSSTAFSANGWSVIRTRQMGLNGAPVWQWMTSNLEEAVVHDVVVTTKPRSQGGPGALLAFGDVLGFVIDNPSVTPTQTVVPIRNFVPEGSSFDFSWGNPDVVTFLGHNDTGWEPYSSISRDGGRTWQELANPAEGGQGGRIALATNDANNMVWMSAGWRPMYFTRNGGQTWALATDTTAQPPDPTTLSTWHLASATWKGNPLVASPVLPNTFYLWSFGRLMVSTDGGETWTNRYAWFNAGGGDQPETWAIDTSVVPHPTRGNEIWLTTRPNDNQTFQSGPYRSVDGGVSFQRLAGVVQANYVSFGKGYEAGQWVVYIHGKVQIGEQIQEGIFRSFDDGAPGSWEYVGPRDNTFPTINSLAADPREPGIVYLGTSGRGAFYGELAPPSLR